MDTCSVDRLRLVVVGHVDHGKSTVLGRLLADAGALPEGRLDDIRRRCEQSAKQFEYAFVLDALADEQAQGITIESARVHFRCNGRHFLVLDAPGHVEFMRNMVTGASHADAAVLVIDAAEGLQENSRRHGSLLALLGVHQVVALVNKMDRVDWSEAVFRRLVDEGTAFLASVGIEPRHWVPVSGFRGDNVASPSGRMPWYTGPTLLQCLKGLAVGGAERSSTLRLYVQDVYRFSRAGDDRRILVGTVDSGTLAAGDEVVFHPSGKRSRVRALEAFGAPFGGDTQAVPGRGEPGRPLRASGATPERFTAGQEAAFTLEEQVYVRRGELVTGAGHPPPRVGDRVHASVFWLGPDPLRPERSYVLKIGTARASARLEALHRVVDAGSLEPLARAYEVGRNQVAECTLRLDRPLAMDPSEFLDRTGRFVLVDDYRIAGGGIVLEVLPPEGAPPGSAVPERSREERLGQRAALVLVTGGGREDRLALARALEARLFGEGRATAFLGEERPAEALAEAAGPALGGGLVLVAPAALSPQGLLVLEERLGPERVVVVRLGEGGRSDLDLPPDRAPEEALDGILDLLRRRGFLSAP